MQQLAIRSMQNALQDEGGWNKGLSSEGGSGLWKSIANI